MSSSGSIVMLLSFLTLLPRLEFHDFQIKYNHSASEHTPGHTRVPVTHVTNEWNEEPHVEGYKNIADKSSSLQTVHSHLDQTTVHSHLDQTTVHSHLDHTTVDRSRHSDIKYPDGNESEKSGTKNLHSILKKRESVGQGYSEYQTTNINYFDQTVLSNTEHINNKEHTSQGAFLSSEVPRTSSQNIHSNPSQNHLVDGKVVDFTGLLASTPMADAGRDRRLSKTINLPCKISNTTADCTRCGLTFVPTDLPRNITRLLLTDNYITSECLYPGVFVSYTQLVELMLDSNNITSLPEGVFEGLEHLKTLSLYNNRITLNMELNNSTVFYPLNNTLEILILNRNTNDTKKKSLVYPDLALSILKHLSRLHIDGLKQKDFGIGFSNLTKLTNLSLAGFQDGFCNMISISNNTFSYLQHLTFLNLSDCHLNGSLIESNAFSNLSKLQVLDVSYNYDLGIHAVGKFMYGLRNNKNFVHLKIVCVMKRFTPCVVVYKHMLRYFKHTGLQKIESMKNNIEMIEVGALEMLPSTLEILNLTDNVIMFGAYWKDMASLTGLKQLHLEGYLNPLNFPFFYPSNNVQCLDIHDENFIDNLNDKQNHGVEKCICGPGTCSSETRELILPLPPKLEVFTMHSSSLAYTVNGIRFCSANNLTSVDLSDNMFKQLDGTVTGLNHIRNLNLSSCFIENIGHYFFDNLTSLEHLNLYQNFLGHCLQRDLDGNIFDKLTNLKYLNLAFNSLQTVNRGAFKDLKNLETLDLSMNNIIQVNFSIKHMTKLTFLDLHKNDITSLPKDFRGVIDELLKTNKSVIIDLSENHIYCECSNLEFLEWMVARRNVFGDNYTNYNCIYLDGVTTAIPMNNGYEEKVKSLRRECSTHGIIFFGAVGGTLILMIVIIGLLLYRFRWTLRYWYHAARMMIYANPHQVSEEFEYDVFVSYASEDVNFVIEELSPHLSSERHLKLMIHGEKFQAGRHIIDNIYMAVRQCRKTLVLITRNMLTSHWCTYELQMARMESISTGRDTLVFLFLEDIPTNLMRADVISYIKTSTYIFYPTDVRHRQAFWNKLADDLRAL